MKLVCQPYCSNECAEHVDLLFIEIDPNAAKILLQVHDRCRTFLEELDKQNLVGYRGGHVSIPSILSFDVVGASSETLQSLLDSFIEPDEWQTVPDSFQPFVYDESGYESNVSRSECHELITYDSHIIITAFSKYCSSERYETRRINVETLAEVSSDRQPSEVKVFDPQTNPSQRPTPPAQRTSYEHRKS